MSKYGERDVLLVVDIQNDFCPGGSLAVPHGDEVVPLVNRLAQDFPHVVLTQDWHPRGHLSFVSSHPGTKPYQTIEVAYGTQVLWPDHCMQGTRGAAFRDDLDIPHAELVLLYPSELRGQGSTLIISRELRVLGNGGSLQGP